MDEKAQMISTIQAALEELRIPAWLFYGFQNLDPIANRILQFDSHQLTTRRWFYLAPADGEPKKLVHQIEPHILDHLPGHKKTYCSWQDLQTKVRQLLEGLTHVAMQHSEKGAIPYVSRVDAGTVDLVRSFGVQVMSSGDLIQHFESVWTPTQLRQHRATAQALASIARNAFNHAASEIHSHGETDELKLQRLILELFQEENVLTDHPPIVAVNENSADPHYQVSERNHSKIREGDFLLIDLFAKRMLGDSVYADITWTAFLGNEPTDEIRQVFEVVRQARDRGVDFLRHRCEAGSPPQGWEVDEAVRTVVREAGYGEFFIHRTGHNLGRELHGNGVHFDNLETHDTRQVIPGIGCTIEPGIYLQGKFGVRSEVNVYISPEGPEVTTPTQDKLLVLSPHHS